MAHVDQAVFNDVRILLSAEAVRLKAAGKMDEARGVARAKLILDNHLKAMQELPPQDHHAGEHNTWSTNVETLAPAGTLCSICHQPQYRTPSGDTCKHGHGGVGPLEGAQLNSVLAAKPELRVYVKAPVGFPPPPV